MMGFYQFAHSISLMPTACINICAQALYYTIMNRYMFVKGVKLFSVARILALHCFIYFVHEEYFIIRYLMNNYKVNINDMFDQDEPFLFSSIEFKRLIKRMHDQYAHLIN